MYSDKENVNILTALLAEHGVEHVVVCPGSRNAPLVHNFNECPSITCHPVTDERSAGFIAIGLSQQLHQVVAVCVTSGSALLNVMPAVAEATYQQCGIMVISADRPSAWIDQLDGQTLPQPNALGAFVAKSVNLPEPHDDEERWYCHRLINEAFLAVKSPSHPSVHINVPISEPFFSFATESLPEVYAVQGKMWSEAKEQVATCILSSSRPLIVIGQTERDAIPSALMESLEEKFPVLSEPLSTDHITITDQLILRIQSQKEDYSSDCVLYLGGHTVSKRLRHFLRSLDKAYHIMVSADGTLHDMSMHTRLVVQASPREVVESLVGMSSNGSSASAYLHQWRGLVDDVRTLHESFLPAYSEMLAVKLFEESITDTSSVYYANSMSVRLASLYADHYCYCNRGVNGIEGSMSVAVGASLAQSAIAPDSKTYCVIGDLSFFYDENALWQQQVGGNLRILLLNNSQGGIFRILKGLEQSPVRDSFVSAHHETSAEGICQQFDVHYLRATDEDSLRVGLDLLHKLKSHRPILLEVLTDVSKDEEEFKRYLSIYLA